MLKGISFSLQPYVLEDDRESEIQTVFHIKPMSGHDANYSLMKYNEARSEARGGQVKLKVGRLDTADETTFVMCVEKIENYQFGDTYPEMRDKGMIAEITSTDQLKMVAKDMPPTYMTEVMEQANKISAITEPERKDSRSSSTTLSGGRKRAQGADSTIAKSAE